MIKSVLLIFNIILILIILFLIYIKLTYSPKKNKRNILDDTEVLLLNVFNYVSNNDTKKHSKKDKYIIPDITIKYSNKINGRGIFANKDYKKGDILEICPCIKVTMVTKIIDEKPLNNYAYSINDEFSLIGVGYCSMYNHSDSPNTEWTIMNDNQLKIEVLRDIQKSEEIFISYGKNYWESRSNKI
jgi:hypothetical protein